MSTSDLEIELANLRSPDDPGRSSNVLRLTVAEALAYRAAGNVPDELGRTLRLVLSVGRDDDLSSIDSKRRIYEPDYHERPSWRREESVPINVVPLREPGSRAPFADPWWTQPELAALEAEWRASGTVHGLEVPGAYRGFVFKTVLALRAAGREITPEAVADSIARWVSPDQAEEIRAALTRP